MPRKNKAPAMVAVEVTQAELKRLETLRKRQAARSVRMSLRLPADLHAELEAEAEASKRTVTAVIVGDLRTARPRASAGVLR